MPLITISVEGENLHDRFYWPTVWWLQRWASTGHYGAPSMLLPVGVITTPALTWLQQEQSIEKQRHFESKTLDSLLQILYFPESACWRLCQQLIRQETIASHLLRLVGHLTPIFARSRQAVLRSFAKCGMPSTSSMTTMSSSFITLPGSNRSCTAFCNPDALWCKPTGEACRWLYTHKQVLHPSFFAHVKVTSWARATWSWHSLLAPGPRSLATVLLYTCMKWNNQTCVVPIA